MSFLFLKSNISVNFVDLFDYGSKNESFSPDIFKFEKFVLIPSLVILQNFRPKMK